MGKHFDNAGDDTLDLAALAACELLQQSITAFGNDRGLVVELLPEILFAVEAGYALKDIHAELLRRVGFKGTLRALRRYLRLESQRHPRLLAAVRKHSMVDFHIAVFPRHPHDWH